MNDIQTLTDALLSFRDERDWEQFHNSKDMAIAISTESAELLELFLWKGNEEVSKERLAEELADVLAYCLLLASKHGLDVKEILLSKIKQNKEKYPVAKAKGSAKKYTEL